MTRRSILYRPVPTHKADPAPNLAGPPSAWEPTADRLDLAVLGKLAEELSEAGAIVARCIIQGVEECEPVTNKPNRQALTEEIADVLANIHLSIERFNLDMSAIDARVRRKTEYLTAWHAMLEGGKP